MSKSKRALDTLVCFLLDETGSMCSCKDQTISGFNEYIATLKKSKNVVFSLTVFNSARIVNHPAIAIADVEELSNYNYKPDMMTPLYDAIGQSINKLQLDLKKMRSKPKVLFVIMTDGEENCSGEFTSKKVFDMISKKKKDNWTFIFLGANQDSWKTGRIMGLDKGNTMNYNTVQIKSTLRSLGEATTNYCNSSMTRTNNFFVDTKYEEKE